MSAEGKYDFLDLISCLGVLYSKPVTRFLEGCVGILSILNQECKKLHDFEIIYPNKELGYL